MRSDRLTVAQIAELVGVRPATWRSYVSREQAPAAVEHLDARTPLWDRGEVEAWAAARRRGRPAAGARTTEQDTHRPDQGEPS